jgi:tRNA dimethylallyltransferase
MNSKENAKPKLIIIAGPTASGKTDYAIKLAKELNGELINADSRQIYLSLDIATNKGILNPINEYISSKFKYKLQAFDVENTGILGWLFNIIYPDEEFNLSIYKTLAIEAIDDIVSRGKQPILIGGTGLYIDSIVNDYQLNPDNEIQIERRNELNLKSVDELFQVLVKINPDVASKLNNSDKNNPRRLIRWIEKTENPSSNEYTKGESKYEIDYHYIDIDKEKLMEKINKRVIQMIDQGLIEETKTAIISGYMETKPLQSFGYKEAIAYLNKEISMEKCIELIQLEHRKYAKRQVTWFKKYNFKN